MPAKKINHPLHIILSVLTLGWWLIPYAVIAYRAGRPTQPVRRQPAKPATSWQELLTRPSEQP